MGRRGKKKAPMPTLSPPRRLFVNARVRDIDNPWEARYSRIALSEILPSPLGDQRCFLEERRAFAKVMSEKGIDPMDEMRARELLRPVMSQMFVFEGEGREAEDHTREFIRHSRKLGYDPLVRLMWFLEEEFGHDDPWLLLRR